MPAKPKVLVTGVSGNLGRRLLCELEDFSVVGVDFKAPAEGASLLDFSALDLGRESTCNALVSLIRQHNVQAVVHLAFVIDPVMTGVLDKKRMWQINVAGTARVMEAIAEANRSGGAVQQFIFPSSVSAYGPELPADVNEDHPLAAHTLTYAIHKKEADELVRVRAEQMAGCSTYLLRPHIFVGRSVENYLVGALRGTPRGTSSLAARMRAKGTRLPLLLPTGDQYLHKRFQFLHIDDMARLIAYILRKPERRPGVLSVLNVAGRGDAVTIAEAAEIAKAKLVRLPTRAACRAVLSALWGLKISSIPPEALPYMVGSFTMDLSRLKEFLGADFTRVIRNTVREALEDTFAVHTSAHAD